ncbi:hypothetical protein PQX77_002238 [Marasmius sp. AFHP31]|nr:hypothetical protein PQX77_002238 [Marasmius sp. AFHP31]
MAPEGSTYHQTFNNNQGSTNYNNTGNGTQNWYAAKTFHQNTGPGQILIVKRGAQGDSDDDDDDGEDQPLSPKELEKELKLYHQRPSFNDDELKKIVDGQEYLNHWQRLIISDLAGETLTLDDITEILVGMIRLSNISGLSPKCLRIQDVGIEILGRPVDVQPAGMEVFKGKVGTLDVIVKALKKERPHDEQLKLLLKAAMTWRKLHHDNVLPFLGLYYFDESRSRLCLVYPWMEQSSLNEGLPSTSKESAADSFNKFAEGVIDGLVYIHGQNVVHGGLRNPSSFLIDLPDRSCIADLGLAQLLGEEATGMNEDSDMFQCARTLYKKLYGCRRIKNPPSRPPHVTDALWEVLEEWLKKGLAASQTEGPLRDNDTT